MEVLFAMSIFDICYGILGLFGKMNIPEKFKGHEWTKDYIRGLAFSNILLGIPYLILYFAFRQYDPGYLKMILFIILSPLYNISVDSVTIMFAKNGVTRRFHRFLRSSGCFKNY